MSRMLSRGTERVRNASGTMPKTKTKTKYLILTSCGSSLLKKLGRHPTNRHLGRRTREGRLAGWNSQGEKPWS